MAAQPSTTPPPAPDVSPVTSTRRKNSASTPAGKAHPYDRLPFVQLPAGGPRDFWAPRPTGDYELDCSLGAEYAAAAIPMLREPGGHQLLRGIVLAMVEHGSDARDRGLIVGMMGVIGMAMERAPGLALVHSAPALGAVA